VMAGDRFFGTHPTARVTPPLVGRRPWRECVYVAATPSRCRAWPDGAWGGTDDVLRQGTRNSAGRRIYTARIFRLQTLGAPSCTSITDTHA